MFWKAWKPNQQAMPKVNTTYIHSEMPEVSRVRMVFAACGTNFVFPRVGLASLRILHRVHGRGAFLDNPCCGLLAFNYGDLETARELARKSGAASRTVKTLVARGLGLALADGLELELRLAGEHMRSPDAAEGLRAFAERRAPVFTPA